MKYYKKQLAQCLATSKHQKLNDNVFLLYCVSHRGLMQMLLAFGREDEVQKNWINLK